MYGRVRETGGYLISNYEIRFVLSYNLGGGVKANQLTKYLPGSKHHALSHEHASCNDAELRANFRTQLTEL